MGGTAKQPVTHEVAGTTAGATTDGAAGTQSGQDSYHAVSELGDDIAFDGDWDVH
jgi:hypothetical protein